MTELRLKSTATAGELAAAGNIIVFRWAGLLGRLVILLAVCAGALAGGMATAMTLGIEPMRGLAVSLYALIGAGIANVIVRFIAARLFRHAATTPNFFGKPKEMILDLQV